MKFKLIDLKDQLTGENTGAVELKIVDRSDRDILQLGERLFFRNRANARAWIDQNIIESSK